MGLCGLQNWEWVLDNLDKHEEVIQKSFRNPYSISLVMYSFNLFQDDLGVPQTYKSVVKYNELVIGLQEEFALSLHNILSHTY